MPVKRTVKSETQRLWLSILLFIICGLLVMLKGSGDSNLIINKVFYWSFFIVGTHLMWTLMLGKYINLAELLDLADKGDWKRAIIFLGACIFRGLFYAGGILAGCLSI